MFRVRVVVGLVISAVALIGLPGRAFAGVLGVFASNGNAPGLVAIQTFSDSPVTQLRAHLVSYQTQQEVAVIDDFTLAYGDRQNGYWQNTVPLHLPVGSYRVDVDATNAGGTQIVGVHAGYYYSEVLTRFDQVEVSPTTVDYYHRTVTMTGRLTGQFPETAEVRPLAGFTVTVMVDYLDTVDVLTGPNGTFTATVTLAGSQLVQAVYRYSNDHLFYTYSESDPVRIAVVQSETRLTAHLSDTAINIEDPLTLTGRLAWRSKQGWQPLAGVRVGVLDGPRVVGPVPTGADGTYSVPIQPYESGTIAVFYYSDDPYLSDAQASVSYTVAQDSAFTDFAAERDETGQVVAHGHIDFPGGHFTPGVIPIQIEFSPGGERWEEVAAVPNADWDGTGYGFSGAVANDRAGYWRARYAGTPDFQPAVSNSVYVGRA